MFYVWDVARVQRPYEPGTIRTSRKVDAITPLQPISALSTAAATAPHSEGNRNVISRELMHYLTASEGNAKRRRIILARDLMTEGVLTISRSTKIKVAWGLFSEHRFRHLPVLEDNQQIVGILSDRDVLRCTAHLSLSPRHGKSITIDDDVEKIMVTNVLVATPDTEIREVARVMFEERVGCIPISAQNGEISGIITRSDVLRALLVNAPLELWS